MICPEPDLKTCCPKDFQHTSGSYACNALRRVSLAEFERTEIRHLRIHRLSGVLKEVSIELLSQRKEWLALHEIIKIAAQFA